MVKNMNLANGLNKLFPQGSYGGECGLFVRLNLADIDPVGNSYADKKKSVDNQGIRASQLQGDFRIGDVLITSEGTNWLGQGYGHVAFVNNIVGDNLYLTESNYRKDGLVSHMRTLPKNSSKIYGVIRRPFKFSLPIPKTITLYVSLLMNHEKQWKPDQFNKWADMVNELSKGKLQLKISPLYTYYALKNWWYKSYGSFDGTFYNVIAKEYIDQQVMPLRFPDTHFLLWCITNKQWHGYVFNHPSVQEIGWYYTNTKPGVATLAVDEAENNFPKYATHELCHWLMNYGNRRGLDMTHHADFVENNLAKVFDYMEWDYFFANCG